MTNRLGAYSLCSTLLLASLLLGACSEGKSAEDVDAAGSADAAGSPDAASGADAAVGADAAGGATDAAPGIDSSGAGTTIAELRGMSDGAVDLNLADVYVTYLSNIGYYIQAEASGPALFVYLDAAPTVAIGNRVDLHVTSLTTYNGVKEIDGSEVIANDGGSYDVLSNLAQDLSAGAGVSPGEALESELVRVYGATITSGTSLVYEIEYGSGPTTATLRASAWETLGLCTGAVLDAVGVVDEDNGSYRMRNFFAADVSNLNTAGCL